MACARCRARCSGSSTSRARSACSSRRAAGADHRGHALREQRVREPDPAPRRSRALPPRPHGRAVRRPCPAPSRAPRGCPRSGLAAGRPARAGAARAAAIGRAAHGSGLRATAESEAALPARARPATARAGARRRGCPPVSSWMRSNTGRGSGRPAWSRTTRCNAAALKEPTGRRTTCSGGNDSISSDSHQRVLDPQRRHQPHPLLAQPAKRERQRGRRLPVEPLHVIDRHDERAPSGQHPQGARGPRPRRCAHPRAPRRPAGEAVRSPGPSPGAPAAPARPRRARRRADRRDRRTQARPRPGAGRAMSTLAPAPEAAATASCSNVVLPIPASPSRTSAVEPSRTAKPLTASSSSSRPTTSGGSANRPHRTSMCHGGVQMQAGKRRAGDYDYEPRARVAVSLDPGQKEPPCPSIRSAPRSS